MILAQLERRLNESVADWCRSKGLEGPTNLALSTPPPHIGADLSSGWPLQAAKQLRKAPVAIAQELAAALKAPLEGQAETGFAPPGFLNLSFPGAALQGNLAALLRSTPDYLRLTEKPQGRLLYEFVSANPTGPVHMASGRAASLGDSMVRILRRLGIAADAEYYINDMGRQVQLLGLSLKARFQKAEPPEGGYAGDYLIEMAAALPAEASGWSDEQFSRHAVEKLLASHKRDMEAFGVQFDRWFRESELHRNDDLAKALALLKSKGLTLEKEGAVWFAAGDKDDKDRVLVRSDGRPTYFLADVAYHHDKLRRGYTTLIDIWGADHHGYVARLRSAVDALGGEGSFEPIVHQMVHLYRGKELVKMSKRSGEFISLAELMEEVGVDACRWFFAMRTPNSHLNFDLELAKKKSQDNPVYYVQYVHARICSIFAEAKKQGLEAATDSLDKLTAPEERAILVKLAWFQDALKTCARERTPHHLAVYLTELAGLYHPFYEKCRVADAAQPEMSRARLALCGGVRAVIAEGLSLLGVSAPERM